MSELQPADITDSIRTAAVQGSLADMPPPETDALARLLDRLEASLTGTPPPPDRTGLRRRHLPEAAEWHHGATATSDDLARVPNASSQPGTSRLGLPAVPMMY
jgi:hypothetical protein